MRWRETGGKAKEFKKLRALSLESEGGVEEGVEEGLEEFLLKITDKLKSALDQSERTCIQREGHMQTRIPTHETYNLQGKKKKGKKNQGRGKD